MKRVYVLITVLCLVVSFTCAFAEDVDLSKMKPAELMELRNRIDDILFSNGDANVGEPIPSGKYKAGQNIKPGKYEITCITEDPEYTPYISTYDVDGKLLESEHFQLYGYRIVELKDGESMTLGSGSFAIKPATIYSWMMD